MSFFTNLGNLFRNLFSSTTKKDKEWGKRFDGKPAQPTHPLPLDPNDPWRT